MSGVYPAILGSKALTIMPPDRVCKVIGKTKKYKQAANVIWQKASSPPRLVASGGGECTRPLRSLSRRSMRDALVRRCVKMGRQLILLKSGAFPWRILTPIAHGSQTGFRSVQPFLRSSHASDQNKKHRPRDVRHL